MTALIAIDQGTTSTRSIIFAKDGRRLGQHQVELPQHFPKPGWVEHDAAEIWRHTVESVRGALKNASLQAREVAAIGITNQRETVVIWDRSSGEPIHKAIVWQDRRSAEFCRTHAERSDWLAERTGLLLDPYFSATKISWILDHVDGARQRAEAGELAFGTIDSWLLYKLTGGKVHATDATNASRTMLFNIKTQQWDLELLEFFDVPVTLLPEVKDCSADFGSTDSELFGGAIRIAGIAGDQQAATVGQACFSPGMIKSTYGTGCFAVLNLGDEFVRSSQRLLTTTAYRLEGKTTYALEGSIFIAGAAVQWLRDALKLIGHAGDTEALARSLEDNGGVYLVPAFTGLGAPYWDPDARGAVIGLTRDAGIAHFARAALESVAYQSRDLLVAMGQDAVPPKEIRVDGGMVVNDWVVQGLADILQIPTVRPQIIETTALGAAYLAGLQVGVYESLDEIAALWQTQQRFEPAMSADRASTLYAGWKDAVARVRSQP